MEQTAFAAPAEGGVLSGWVGGDGDPVLILHGGPGMSFTYADDIAAELVGAFRVANFQQRGLAPSVEDGPFTIEALADIVAVLDHLGPSAYSSVPAARCPRSSPGWRAPTACRVPGFLTRVSSRGSRHQAVRRRP
jgi:hypothetical protein